MGKIVLLTSIMLSGCVQDINTTDLVPGMISQEVTQLLVNRHKVGGVNVLNTTGQHY